jgi:hypothetical protein
MPLLRENPPPASDKPWLSKTYVEPWWKRLEFLDPLREPWQPVSKIALIAWLVIYALYLIYAARATGSLFMDNVFLPIHEGGHLLFSYLGNQTLMVMGGTFLQLFVPLALAVYFAFQRQVTGTAFAAFFFFENFLNIGTYMADARAQVLPLVTVGGGEGIHDWGYLFAKFGLINQDIFIGHATRALGWLGMLAVVGWLLWRGRAVKS